MFFVCEKLCFFMVFMFFMFFSFLFQIDELEYLPFTIRNDYILVYVFSYHACFLHSFLCYIFLCFFEGGGGRKVSPSFKKTRK